MNRWYLQGTSRHPGALQEIPLIRLPQVLGRDDSLTCIIQGETVSRNHAQIDMRHDGLWLTDLNSSNGTFVNRSRISRPTKIDHGDVIHLGSTELRLIDRNHTDKGVLKEPQDSTNATRMVASLELSDHFPTGVRDLEALIDNAEVNIVYQPIVRAGDLSYCGFEALCRGASNTLPKSPMELFRIAESFGLEVPLSQMLRRKAADVAHQHKLTGDILLNTHPVELQSPDRLIGSLVELRQLFPNLPLTLEIHEQAVTADSKLLLEFKNQLSHLHIKLAFDDFGVGQSRLMDMVEAKPDLIKFDRKLIDSLDTADASRINLLSSLVNLAKDLEIETLAECVSNKGEYDACQPMNFHYYQGYYFAKPQPASNFIVS